MLRNDATQAIVNYLQNSNLIYSELGLAISQMDECLQSTLSVTMKLL